MNILTKLFFVTEGWAPCKYDDADFYNAGIDCTEDCMCRIVVYGETEEETEEIRSHVLSALRSYDPDQEVLRKYEQFLEGLTEKEKEILDKLI